MKLLKQKDKDDFYKFFKPQITPKKLRAKWYKL